MNPFDFNPLEVGNPMTLGMMEEELEDKLVQLGDWYADAGPWDEYEKPAVLETLDINYYDLSYAQQLYVDDMFM